MYDGDRSESDLLFWLARNSQHSKLDAKTLQEDLQRLLAGDRLGDSNQQTKRIETSVLEEL